MTQLRAWKGAFGKDYIERNPVDEAQIRRRSRTFAEILRHLPAPDTILEVGANVGINCHALGRISDATVSAIEPNEQAFAELRSLLGDRAHLASAFDLPFPDATFDLVFTSGVLIHIPPQRLGNACKEIFRVSRRFVLAIEYFAKDPCEAPYRGEAGMLFKRDFGGYWLDHFDLEPVANGFFWQRTTGLDDLHWWLFNKRSG